MNGNSLVVDPKTGFLTPSKNYSLTGFTADIKAKVIELLKTHPNVGRVCKAVGVDRISFYHALGIDPAFKRAYDDLIEDHVDDVDSDMFNRAKQPNGTLAGIFILKNRRSAIYGDRTTVLHQSRPADTALSTILDVSDSSQIAQPEPPPTGALPLVQGTPTS